MVSTLVSRPRRREVTAWLRRVQAQLAPSSRCGLSTGVGQEQEEERSRRATFQPGAQPGTSPVLVERPTTVTVPTVVMGQLKAPFASILGHV